MAATGFISSRCERQPDRMVGEHAHAGSTPDDVADQHSDETNSRL